MTSWISEYQSALDARDSREKANSVYIEAYTKLADRTATLTTASQALPSPPVAPTALSKSAVRPSTPRGKSSPPPVSPEAGGTPDTLARLRADLTATQRERVALETRAAALTTEVTALRAQTALNARRIGGLERAKELLERKVKDRDEEIRGKGRLVEEVQDEMVALNLQLNMAEQRVEKLKAENEELTRRWMEKMEREAKEMNERSRWS
ncbi:autophagy protein 16 [Cenococcum geophilum 1.58]|uniref:autophagy protein 16 n=1 Tax=Cenococcum geophilum 1.58 TaxID=794803 RepID=UPI00358F8562|nr:autophagy protein 16 [Cenococcum geophilum 1.58]